MEALGLPLSLNDRIFDYGRVTDESMAHIMTRCHAVLAPSRYQSFGSVYHEAAAFGRPLIACAEDPTAVEFIRHHDCGVLAEACTPQDVAQAIISMFNDRQAMLSMRKAGLEAARNWTRDQLGARTLQIYRRAMRLEAIDIPATRNAAAQANVFGRIRA